MADNADSGEFEVSEDVCIIVMSYLRQMEQNLKDLGHPARMKVKIEVKEI